MQGWEHLRRMDNALRRIRKSLGLTIPQAAGLVGMSKGGYEKKESGDRRLDLEFLERAAAAFGVPVSALIDHEGDGSEYSEVERVLAPRLVTVRVVGTVEAGAFREVDEFDQSEFDEIQVAPDPRFPNARQAVWTVAGDSMNALEPRPILPGDQLVCIDFQDLKNKVPLRDGMIAIVERTRDGGQTREWSVKQIELYEDRTEFHPRSRNPRHKPIVVPHDFKSDDGQEVSVLAIVRRGLNEFPM